MNYLSLYLGILLFSFIFTGIAIVPWIDLLYKLQMTERKKKLFGKNFKLSTPVGGGILLIFCISFLFSIIFPVISQFGVYIRTIFSVKDELNLIFFTFISFGLVGLYDDLVKIFNLKKYNISKYKNIIIIGLCVFVSILLYQNLGISILNLPFVGVVSLGPAYIILAALVIMVFVKGFNATDNLDGISCGGLLINLIAFWVIASNSLDTPISVFLALWIGGLLAFLYFNVYPARVWLGNCGSYSFGATLGVIGLILGKPVAILLIGLFFSISAILSLFKISPYQYLLSKGWAEPKIVMRAWLFVLMTSVIGLWISGI